jgi:hypothetical protein
VNAVEVGARPPLDGNEEIRELDVRDHDENP